MNNILAALIGLLKENKNNAKSIRLILLRVVSMNL